MVNLDMGDLPPSARPVPQELWQPLEKRIRVSFLELKAGAVISMLGAFVAVVDTLVHPFEVGWMLKVTLPVALVGVALGTVGMIRGRRTLQRCRALMLEYHGRDPGPPPWFW